MEEEANPITDTVVVSDEEKEPKEVSSNLNRVVAATADDDHNHDYSNDIDNVKLLFKSHADIICRTIGNVTVFSRSPGMRKKKDTLTKRNEAKRCTFIREEKEYIINNQDINKQIYIWLVLYLSFVTMKK